MPVYPAWCGEQAGERVDLQRSRRPCTLRGAAGRRTGGWSRSTVGVRAPCAMQRVGVRAGGAAAQSAPVHPAQCSVQAYARVESQCSRRACTLRNAAGRRTGGWKTGWQWRHGRGNMKGQRGAAGRRFVLLSGSRD
eukprot:365545-Chlamydomonas_euryale.AAC.5